MGYSISNTNPVGAEVERTLHTPASIVGQKEKKELAILHIKMYIDVQIGEPK